MKSTSFSILIFSIFLLSYLSIVPIFVSAQATLGLSQSDISVDIEPPNPGPNQTVSITLQSFATDLNAANITWSVNGKKTLSGNGQKQLTVTTGGIGKQTTVSITVNSQAGTVNIPISISPASVDMIWEAHTYTPPFFKGKALFTSESNITFVAIPHIIRNGSEVNPANLIYTWSNNGTVLGDQSGYGKNTLNMSGSIIPRPMDITVEASDPVTGSIADGETTVAPGSPFVLFYINNPLFGVQYENALQTTYPLGSNQVEISAVPYYFSAVTPSDGSLTYDWEINGAAIDDGQNSANKTFVRTGDTTGASNVSVTATQTDRNSQSANTSVVIDFTKAVGQGTL